MTSKAEKARKLATGNLDFVIKSINAFWCSESYTVDPATLRIVHPTKDMNGRFAVRAVGRGAYVFESRPAGRT